MCAQSALRWGFTRGAELKEQNLGAHDASEQQLEVSPSLLKLDPKVINDSISVLSRI